MKHSRRIDWVVVAVALVFAASCSGGGCGGCGVEPIPGGFPAGKRTANAGQVRVSQSALAKIAADPAAVIGPLIGGAMNGIIEFDIPGSCGGDPQICCVNGVPAAACGPLEIDLVARPADQPRLVLTPVSGQSRLDMTIRSRVKTKMALPIRYLGVSCNAAIDTTRGGAQDLRIDAQLQFSQDPTAGTTRLVAQNVSVTQLDDNDITISGNVVCTLAGALIGLIKGQLVGQIESILTDTINDATCKACDSGQLAECGSSFATACTNNTCMIGNRCQQELGLAGRMRGSSLFGGFSPGTTGALDLYEVAGGYTTTQQNGVALGLLGGMQPGGEARDKCGPSATEPGAVTIPISPFFQGNTRPDTNAPFDVAIGLHKQQLAEFAYAGYEGGLLCLTIGASTVSQLSTDTLSLVSRSLGNLVETNSAMAVGLRPQSAPQITLGKNTFMTDAMGNATLLEPLLDLRFTAMEIDFFASVDDQWIRVFTVVSDVHLPIGLQTSSMSEIVPVIGAVDNAFTNLSVKNSEAITETPQDLAGLFPALLGLVLPQLSGGLGGFALPSIGGLNLQVTEITAVDNDNFLAIFANLVTALPAARVDTRVTLVGVAEPAAEVARAPSQWSQHTPPAVTLDFGTADGLEWSYAINGGAWSAWSTNRRPTLSPYAFWVPGQHKIEVRARSIGQPATIDPSPELIELVLGTDVALGNGKIANNGFHGQAGSSGCSCETGGNAGGAGALALVLFGLVLPWRRRIGLRHVVAAARTAAWHLGRLGAVVWIAALASLQGCSCGSAPCGDVECLPGEVAHGGHGRYTSIAADGDRVMVATYDQGLGDLVVIDATDPAAPSYVVVDGVPDLTPIYDPSTYRGGIEDAGDDVGTWTSIAMSNDLAKVAYHDRANFALKYAYETKRGAWSRYTIEAGDADLGSHASLVIDADNRPAIAYLAVGVDDGMGHRVTELRLVRSTVVTPTRDVEWTPLVIARAEGTCAGLCGGGSVCTVAVPELCATTTADCTATCGAGTACVAGSCVDTVADPMMATLATGTGLFVNLLLLPDGRLAAVYYDRNARALVAAVESAAGANDFVATTLDVADPGDRGMWASAIADASGTIHVAYQDALGDQLLYLTFNGTATTPEVVDDGQRPGDRTHHVGAASAIYLVGGAPVIAYQDGTSSDVYVATKSGATWTPAGFVVGPLLDGFSIAATTAHGDVPYLAWGMLDPAASPLGSVVVQNP